MPLGPLDRRCKRSRCDACFAGHLKCSGQQPCATCKRRSISCTFSDAKTSRAFIHVDQRKAVPDTSKNRSRPAFKSVSRGVSSNVSVYNRVASLSASSLGSPCRLTDEHTRYFYFFDVFASRNRFDGRGSTASDELKELSSLNSTGAGFLTDAMLSLGALHSVKLGAPGNESHHMVLCRSLRFYSRSVVGLRGILNEHGKKLDELREAVLWTTLLLGLFELTNDATGNMWQQHMVYGTARALDASGPAACRTGHSRGFFLQARVFEICRTILFNERTFLTRPEWLRMTRELWLEELAADWRPLDSLLDIMVMCSDLCVRAAAFVGMDEESTSYAEMGQATSSDGFQLMQALQSWYESYADNTKSPSLAGPLSRREDNNFVSFEEGDDMALARVFFSAISIYLSGIFQYEIASWSRLQLPTPSLEYATVQSHVETILDLTRACLNKTTLSSLLFLFPLRIAGRSLKDSQRVRVMELVGEIQSEFAVAGAIAGDLRVLWSGDRMLTERSHE